LRERVIFAVKAPLLISATIGPFGVIYLVGERIAALT
jgi:hypothetical protein